MLDALLHFPHEPGHRLTMTEGATRSEVGTQPSVDIEWVARRSEGAHELHDGVFTMARTQTVVLLGHHRLARLDHHRIRSRERFTRVKVERAETVEPSADHVARRPDHDEDLPSDLCLTALASASRSRCS